MRKSWVGIGVLLLVFISHLSFAESQKATGPKMVLEEKSVDYKQVDEGEVIQHTFNVRNDGDQVLQIKSVKPG